MHSDLFPFYGRIGIKLLTFQVRLVHIHSTDLVVVVSIIIVNNLLSITAGSIKRNLKHDFYQLAAAPLLVYAAKNVEKLAYTFFF